MSEAIQTPRINPMNVETMDCHGQSPRSDIYFLTFSVFVIANGALAECGNPFLRIYQINHYREVGKIGKIFFINPKGLDYFVALLLVMTIISKVFYGIRIENV